MVIKYNPYNWEIRPMKKIEEKELSDIYDAIAFHANMIYSHQHLKDNENIIKDNLDNIEILVKEAKKINRK